MTNFIPSTDKLEVFEALLKARKSSYALQDKGLISDDSVVAQEENALMTQAWVMEPKKKVRDIIKEMSIPNSEEIISIPRSGTIGFHPS